ncbi:MAG TPA: DUF4258 domain-containing protein [Ktedonobacterales bacterium]|nr:DUF4258 domain-containing protein [Ktedonobacterales bacterium]
MSYARLVYRVHAVQRMAQRGVSENEVRLIMANGEVIEDYPTDSPYPSQLLLGWSAGRPLHVVAAQNDVDQETNIITVYEPDPARWTADFRRRLP